MSNLKILIIDDEEQDIKSMTLALKKEGYTDVSSSDTGQKGLEIARSLKPDVVLIDVVLNGIDGFDVCRQIEAAEGITPKIIMVTGHLDAIDARKARGSGADEIIEKKAGFKNLARVIKDITG